MIVLAALIHIPERAIAAFGTGMILIHNAFDGVTVASFQGPGSPVPGFWATIWHILHVPGVIFPLGAGGPTYFVLYPLIPWIGVMAAGYAFGAVYRLDQVTRRRVLIRMTALAPRSPRATISSSLLRRAATSANSAATKKPLIATRPSTAIRLLVATVKEGVSAASGATSPRTIRL